MSFVVNHGVDPGLLMSAIASMAARQQAEQAAKRELDTAEQQQRIDASRASTTLARDKFNYDRVNDQAQRQHALDTINAQYDRLEQRDQQQFDRLPQRLQLEAEAKANAEDTALSIQQQREMARLDQAELTLQTDPSFTDDERASGIEEITRRRKALQTANAVAAQSPWPKDQDVGKAWQLAPGIWVARNNKGNIELIHRADQSDMKLADYVKLYDSVAASMAGPDGTTVADPAAVEAAVQQRLQAFERMKIRGSPSPTNPLAEAGPSSNPVTGPSFQGDPAAAPTAAGSPRGFEIVGSTVTPQARQRLAPLIPPDHPIYNLPKGAQFQAANLNGKPGVVTAEQLVIAAQKFNLPIDALAQLLGIARPPQAAPAAPTPVLTRQQEDDLASSLNKGAY